VLPNDIRPISHRLNDRANPPPRYRVRGGSLPPLDDEDPFIVSFEDMLKRLAVRANKQHRTTHISGDTMSRSSESTGYTQFSTKPGNRFSPATATTLTLPAGVYVVGEDHHGYYLELREYPTRDLIRFPNTLADEIINESIKFWTKSAEYAKMGEPHKRAYLLYGPPGSGKSSLIAWLMNDFIKQGNIVFIFNESLIELYETYRQIPAERDRRVLIIMEDIDALLEDGDTETQVLQFLDGTIQHTNTLIVGTTNYPEKLEERIIDRPSRFDRVAMIDMPGPDERRAYIEAKTILNPRTPIEIDKIVKDTERLSLAHIKELLVATDIMGDPYDEILDRLKKLKTKKPSSDDSKHKNAVGFGAR